MVELNGTELTIEQVMAVARHKEQVRISEPAEAEDRPGAGVCRREACAKGSDLRPDDRLRQIFRYDLSQNRRQPRSSAT